MTYVYYGLIGIAAGILSGMFGIGGGIIIIPMLSLLGMSQLDAQGTSVGILLLPVGILAFLQYYKSGHVDLKAAAIIVVFLVAFSFLGARLALNLPVPVLKKAFGVLMLLMSLKFIFLK